MITVAHGNAAFEVLEVDRARLVGQLHYNTVGALLPAGEQAIGAGRAASIDLKDVTESDSAGLALLIEWLSFAQSVKRPLRYENVPTQIRELAHLSDLEGLLNCVLGR
jgi:phospholipid transport system transporter-binding protein